LWEFVTAPAAFVVIIATFAIAWPLGRRMAARYRCSPAIAILFVIAIGAILALTLTPSEPSGIPFPRPPHFLQQLGDGRLIWANLVTPPDDSEELANIAIYLPAGFLGRFVWGSVGRATSVGLVLTIFIETCQYGVIGRAGSITDIRNNTLGAFFGALLAAMIIHGRRRRADQAADSAKPPR
jgi:glycopeptide antibiotics resistance protein